MKLPGTNFNPRSPHGERPAAVCCLCRWRYFNPRSPHGERPGWSILSAIISVFQSTLPARGATFNQSPFAVHASFQSTLPARGATGNRARYWYRCHFNPRSPHGERRYSFLAARRHSSISIHAPRTGSDYFIYQQQSSLLHFNPRSPHGERLAAAAVLLARTYFNPRSPHGERRDALCCVGGDVTDISIHAPRTGSDERREHLVPLTGISIHAPRTGSDCHKHMWD